MTTATSSPTTNSPTTKRHPIRGAIYGLVFGIGLALIVIGRKIVTLDSVLPIVLIVVGVIVGIAWSMFGPARKPSGERPAAESPATDDTASESDDADPTP